tara:strand:+ start:33 stop:626 length:594 start_codon:yes stop_codon:yes gene_type:complete
MNSDYIYTPNFLTSEECNLLVDYLKTNLHKNAKSGKVDSNVNPRFNNRVVYYEGVDDPKIKSLMKRIHLDVAKKLKDFYKEYDEILPEATHLVKWPVGTSLGNHADNAYENGKPNYVSWRTYSAIIYLNDDYRGGEFYFKRLAYDLQPEKGLLVAFTAGMKHVHGVREVKTGVRYAMPMWFVGDKNKDKAYQDSLES